jgi:hypothetical protein
MSVAKVVRKMAGVVGVIAVVGWASGCGAPATGTVAATHRVSAPAAKRRRTPVKRRSERPRMGLPQPTLAHPLKILVIGDSLGEDLEYGLMDITGTHSNVEVIGRAVGSSGLLNTNFYNWPRALNEELAQYHPALVMVMMGTNDAWSFYQDNQYVQFGSALWRRDYGARVVQIINEARHAGARVIWVGLPVMGPNADVPNTSVATLNNLFAEEARLHPQVDTFISTWSLFRNAQGQFTEYLTDSEGMTVVVRDPDELHIAPPAGDELIASYVLATLGRLEHISLCLSGSDLWTQYHLARCSAK